MSEDRPRARARYFGQAVALAVRASPALVVASAVVGVVGGLAPLALVWITKLAVDRVVAGGSASVVILLVAGLSVAGATIVVAQHVRRYVDRQLERAVLRLTRARLFGAINRFTGLSRFEDPQLQDRLRLAQQTGHLGPSQVVGQMLSGVQGAISAGGLFGVLAALNVWLSVIVLLSAGPALYAEMWLNRRRAALLLALEHGQRRDIFYSGLLSGVDAAKEIRLLGIAPFFTGRMLTELRALHRSHAGLERRECWVQVALGLATALIGAAALGWAAYQATAGTITIGDLAMVLAAVPSVQSAVATVVGSIANGHEALLMYHHYDVILRITDDLPRSVTPVPTPALTRGIELRDVWFRYSENHPWTLRGVNLTIPHGSSVALVGRNGAGKSTLVKLLCRFYDPDRGTILWDGVDLRDLDVATLRGRIGAVFQDFMEYDLTAAENIAVGDIAALDDRDRIRDAARRALADEAIERLPRGYDTLLTRVFWDRDESGNPEAGVPLSGGQWQRIALARAFLRTGQDLLILDEPSAGLDAEAEYRMHRQVREHRRGRTSLLISHRLNTLRDADVIAVLDEGRILECGVHAELVAADGIYAELFGMQADGYQPEPAYPS